MEKHSEEYSKTLQSKRWSRLRAFKVRSTGSTCEACRKRHDTLELHHLHYDTIGQETTADVALLCRACHEVADEERGYQTRARAAERRYDKALNTYATKKYGEGWQSWCDHPDIVAEEFDSWVSRKNGF